MYDPVQLAVIFGLLVGAGVCGHALRIVTLREDMIRDDQQRGRYFVALSAIVFYSVSAVLVGLGWTTGLVLSVVGPFIGITAVLLLKQKVDTFQKVLGVFQLIPVVMSAKLLIVAILVSGILS